MKEYDSFAAWERLCTAAIINVMLMIALVYYLLYAWETTGDISHEGIALALCAASFAVSLFIGGKLAASNRLDKVISAQKEELREAQNQIRVLEEKNRELSRSLDRITSWSRNDDR